jgi:FkbM family methyltransferase
MKVRPRYNTLVPTDYGLMIVNSNDWAEAPDGTRYGIGYDLTHTGCYQQGELDSLAMLVRTCPPDPVLVDVGANIGVHSLWFAGLAGAGVVHAFEAQRVVFQALMGNLALNSIENVFAHQVALGAAPGRLRLQPVDYAQPWNFGGMGLIDESPDPQFAHGTPERAAADRGEEVEVVTLDSFALDRVDLIKIDVEGMEEDVLRGGAATIERHRPLMQLEWLGRDGGSLPRHLLGEIDYRVYQSGLNLLCVPAERTDFFIAGAQEISLQRLLAQFPAP